jgi:hypothetical protein
MVRWTRLVREAVSTGSTSGGREQRARKNGFRLPEIIFLEQN